jgi:hypothetical protein
MSKKIIACVALLALVSSCGDSKTEDTLLADQGIQCDEMMDITPFCGYKNPEDLALIPGTEKLLVSEMGEFRTDAPGGLSLLNLTSGKKEDISIEWDLKLDNWGDSSCPQPEKALFSPHGIDLMTRADGEIQVLVVNHGGREAVEFFNLVKAENAWQLEWRGCAMPPEDPFINDVAALNDGGFLVTHMWNKTQAFEAIVAQLLAGDKTGWVWEWHPESGFRKLPGSLEQMPNGIAVSQDNRHVFVNIYMGNKTIKLDRESGELLGEFDVQQPDNITYDDEGQLWVASHQHNPILQTCDDVESGPCLLPFEIVKADADTMESKVVLSHDGKPMGYTTVALHHGDHIYMGSAHGDRIASFKLSEK